MATVTVHKWKIYDVTTDECRTSRRMATIDAIEWAHGEPIEGTAREVDTSELDPAITGMTPRDFSLRSNRQGFQTMVMR